MLAGQYGVVPETGLAVGRQCTWDWTTPLPWMSSSCSQPQLPCSLSPADVVTFSAASAAARFFTTPEKVTMIGAADPDGCAVGIWMEARSVRPA